MSALAKFMNDQEIARLDPKLFEKIQEGFREIYAEGVTDGLKLAGNRNDTKETPPAPRTPTLQVHPSIENEDNPPFGFGVTIGEEEPSPLFVPRQMSVTPSRRTRISRTAENFQDDEGRAGFEGGFEDDFNCDNRTSRDDSTSNVAESSRTAGTDNIRPNKNIRKRKASPLPSMDANSDEDEAEFPVKKPMRKNKKVYYISKYPGGVEIKDADDFITLNSPQLDGKEKFFKVRRSDFWANGQALIHLDPIKSNQSLRDSLYSILRKGKFEEVNRGWFYVPLECYKKAATKFGVLDKVKLLIEYAEKELEEMKDQILEDPGY